MPSAAPAAPPTWVFVGSVGLGGMLGGSTRYLVSLAMPAEPGRIPWGILAVNLFGAFLLAVLLGGWLRRGHTAHPWRPFVATGILGSFTTWSTFMADAYDLYRLGPWPLATVYLVGAPVLGILAAWAGWVLAHRLVPAPRGAGS